MSYRWKPNASQKAEYRRKCEERESLKAFTTSFAIREGCKVEYYSMNTGEIVSGTVVKSSYGGAKNQHTFTIETSLGKVLVKGRNLYPNILKHEPGEISRKESRN